MATGISRVTLPAEFYDITSDQLLLQPEPQYLHARLIKNALAISMLNDDPGNGALPVPGRNLPTGGAPYLSATDVRLMLANDIYSQAIRVFDEFQGQKVGHTLRVNRPRFTDSKYTQADREVAVGKTISTTPIGVQSDSVPLTLKRFVGPHDGTAPAPISIERFDVKRSVHDLEAVRMFHFQRDFDKTVDTFGVALFDAVDSGNILYPDGMTQDNDSQVAGDYPLDFGTVQKTQTKLDTLSIPVFPNGRRLFVATPLQCEQLSRDPEFQRLSFMDPNVNPLYNGTYFKSVGNFDILKSQTLTKKANGNSINIQYGQAFGPGMVGVGQGELPRVMPNAQDNYGETVLAVWIWYAALSTLDSRFGCSVRSS